MGEHVDMELRHGAGGTSDRTDRAGLVDEVGDVRDVHRTQVNFFRFSAPARHVDRLRFGTQQEAAYLTGPRVWPPLLRIRAQTDTRWRWQV